MKPTGYRNTALRVALLGALYLVPLLLYGTMYAVDQERYDRYFECEDGLVEWVTFAAFFAAGILTFLLLRHRRHMNRLAILYLVGLGLFCIVCAGEEISWGQRLFGFETPEAVKKINEQGEFNLHNLNFENLHPLALAELLMSLFGLAVPIIGYRWMRSPDASLRRYFPPTTYIPLFLMPQLVKPILQQVFPLFTAHRGLDHDFWASMRESEISEMYWGLAMLFALMAMLRAWKRYPPRAASAPAKTT